ncbi:putative ribonuclease H-like domain-containing protein [Tanacetum coccineum]
MVLPLLSNLSYELIRVSKSVMGIGSLKVLNSLKLFVQGNPEEDLKDYAIIDSGCSGSMTGDKDKLSDFKEFKGGYVAFGNDSKDKECLISYSKIQVVLMRIGNLRALERMMFYSWDLKYIIPSGWNYLFGCKGNRGEAVAMAPSWAVNFKNIKKKNKVGLKAIMVRVYFKAFKLGITLVWHVKGSPQQNGVAERKNRTLIEAARTMLADSLLPIQFWAEAVNTACYVLNRVLFEGKSEEGYAVGYSMRKQAKGLESIKGPKKGSRLSSSTANTPPQSTGNTPTDSDDDTPTDGVFSTNLFRMLRKGGVADYIYLDLTIDTEEASDRGNQESLSSLSRETLGLKRCIEELLQFKLQETRRRVSDYDEVFAPVARIEAIRLFLAFASFMGFTVYQMDVKSAFLYGNITEEVYVKQPPGFEDPAHPNKDFEDLMQKEFKMSSMGELTFFLGLQVKQSNGGIFLSQDKYVKDILNKFDFRTIKPASTPIEAHKSLGKDEEGEDVDVHLYRSMIGCLMYLTASRPDIMFAVCLCARFQVTPKKRLQEDVNILAQKTSFLALQEENKQFVAIPLHEARICSSCKVL